MSKRLQVMPLILLGTVMMLLVSPRLVMAAAATTPAATPKPPPTHRPYQTVVQNDVTAAYAYRTRILAGKPECQRYATESDAVFLDAKMDDETKVSQLKRIGEEASARNCLAP